MSQTKSLKPPAGPDEQKGEGEGDKNVNQYKIISLIEQNKKHLKMAALALAAILFFIVLAKTNLTYTNLTADKTSMLILFWVIVLAYCGGNKPLKVVAIILGVLYFIPVFFQTPPQQIGNEITSMVRPATPPREIVWTPFAVTEEPKEFCRVYSGDVLYYISDKGFWFVGDDGKKFFCNPSYGRTFKFELGKAKPGGETLKIWGEPDQIRLKINNS